MDKLDRAVKRLTDDWPANPYWIFTSPDGRDWTSQDSGTSEYIRRLTND